MRAALRMRVALYRPVHVTTMRSQNLRMLLTHRKLLRSKAIAIDNDLRGTLRNFGLKVGAVGKVRFEARIKDLVENVPDLAELVELLLIVKRAPTAPFHHNQMTRCEWISALLGRVCSSSLAPLTNFHRWRDRSTVGPSFSGSRVINPLYV